MRSPITPVTLEFTCVLVGGQYQTGHETSTYSIVGVPICNK